MLQQILSIIKSSNINARNSDTVDKLNSKYVAIFLCFLALFVTANQLVGDTIDCWTPAHFTGQWVKYTDTICWVSNTYYLPHDRDPGREGKEGKHTNEIKYYQWVPVILAVQALLFFLPSVIWHTSSDSLIEISSIVAILQQAVMDPDKRDKLIKSVAEQINRYLKNRRDYKGDTLTLIRRRLSTTNNFCLTWGSRHGNYLGFMYLLCKVLFVLNAWLQLFALEAFLGAHYYSYGTDVMTDMYYGRTWTNSKRFPRVSLCDFSVRTMGKPQHHTLQCVLSINLFNERIFLVIWFILLFVAVVNALNFLMWLWRMMFRSNRYNYIFKHLLLMDKLSNRSEDTLDKFVDRYLQHDGCFVIQIIAKNSTSLITSEMIAALFDKFIENDHNLEMESVESTSSRQSLRKFRNKYDRQGTMPPPYNIYLTADGRRLIKEDELELMHEEKRLDNMYPGAVVIDNTSKLAPNAPPHDEESFTLPKKSTGF